MANGEWRVASKKKEKQVPRYARDDNTVNGKEWAPGGKLKVASGEWRARKEKSRSLAAPACRWQARDDNAVNGKKWSLGTGHPRRITRYSVFGGRGISHFEDSVRNDGCW